MPLLHKEQESGVGRWHTIRLTTLSFYEYLKLKQETFFQQRKSLLSQIEEWSKDPTEFFKPQFSLPTLPQLKSLRDLFNWHEHEFYRVSEIAKPYIGHFHEYLLRGGFPQTAQVESIHQAQRLLREDIIDKVLKRDMTALFGVRRVLDLEQTFTYLCMHDGGLLDMQILCSNLEVNRQTAQHFIELLEATHLIYRLPPFGHGKEILRAKYKIYLADAAITPAVLLKGKTLLDDPTALGIATETSVFKHLFARFYSQNIKFTYWRGKKIRKLILWQK